MSGRVGDAFSPDQERDEHCLLLDTAFEQIRHYSASDIVVSLRLLRAFGDLASSISDPDLRRLVIGRAERVVDGCSDRLPGDDLVKLRHRMAQLVAAEHETL